MPLPMKVIRLMYKDLKKPLLKLDVHHCQNLQAVTNENLHGTAGRKEKVTHPSGKYQMNPNALIFYEICISDGV